MNLNNEKFYICKYCDKKFLDHIKYEKHSCERGNRYKFCKTKTGLNAFEMYKKWIFLLKKRNVNQLDTFIDSKFYVSFVEFEKFSKFKGIPDKIMYINYMIEKNIQPSLWRNDTTYNSFISYFDMSVPPLKKVKITLTTMHNISLIFDCKISEVFNYLQASDICTLIYERRFSQWLLLLSAKFTEFIRKTTGQSRILLDAALDRVIWQDKLNDDPNSTTQIKKILQEFNL